MFLRKIIGSALALLTLSAAAYSQELQAGTQEAMRQHQEKPGDVRRHGRITRRQGLRGMRELNLTEEQRKQQREILQRHLGNTKSQREELFKLREKRIAGTFGAEDEARVQTLRKEIHSSMHSIRTEMEGVLTAEQRERLEQLKTERKARRDQMRERRRELRERRDQIPL